MESDRRYYERRIKAEALAAERALTVEAKQRRLCLVASYRQKLDAACA
mgnify:CR=1 FL=1